jgi:hypothetical protein
VCRSSVVSAKSPPPMRTLVAPKNQKVTIFFREPMNHASVEDALKMNKLEGGVEPSIDFSGRKIVKCC